VRLMKMLGLAAFSAVAAMAFLGAGTAAALPHEQYGLCKAKELLLCAAGNLIPVGSGTLLGKAENPVLEGTLAEKCATSLAKGKVTGVLDEKGRLKTQIDSLTFTGCEPCKKVTVNNLPLAGEITMNTTLGSDWHYTSKGNASLTECSFGLTCKFGSENVLGLLEYNAAGTSTVLNTNKAELKFEGGSEFFCGKIGKWNARYDLTWTLTSGGAEDPVFPTLLGTA
jgi:hypothetical protein